MIKLDIDTLKDIETRERIYGNLTSFLELDEPSNFLDILNAIDKSHPRDLESLLGGTKGRRFDFIGGGIIGVTSAYIAGELSRTLGLDWEIHVWDREKGVGYCSTADSAARTRTSMFGTKKETIGNLATTLFFENLPRILERGYKEVDPGFDFGEIDTDLSRCGYLWLWEKASELEAVKSNQRILHELGLPAFILEPSQVKNLLMPRINAERFNFAYFCPTDAHVGPTDITNAIYRYCKQVLGINFHFDEEISKISVDTGKPIRFSTVSGSAEQQTYYLGITTGARSGNLGSLFYVNDKHSPLQVPIIPKFRQLTYTHGLSKAELEEHTVFSVLMGRGAYWSKDSLKSDKLIFGYARKEDPEVASSRVHSRMTGSYDYFADNMLIEARLDGIHEDISIDSGKLKVFKHRGNLYGETLDGNYLVGLCAPINSANPDGIVGINAAHNGHGIMSSFSTSLHLIYRLTGIIKEESQLWNPNRTMKPKGETVML